MSVPGTVAELVEWLSETHDAAVVQDLVEHMLARPDPFAGGAVTIGSAWKWIIDLELLYRNPRIGWIDRNGRILGVAHAAHEKLLYWLDMEARDAEEAGWARVSPNGWQCTFRLSRPQCMHLEKMGHLVDKECERIKPIWSSPEPAVRPLG